MLFKCLRSGNTVDISDPEDIARMKTHEGYIPYQGDNHGLPNEKTTSTEDAPTLPHQDAQAKEVKRRGRPPKK